MRRDRQHEEIMFRNLDDFLIVAIFVAVAWLIFHRRKPVIILSHWYHLIEDFHYSSLEFYRLVQQALERRYPPDSFVVRIVAPEGSLFSAKREYLRVTRNELIMDICGAPFGSGFFVSWWLVREIKVGCLLFWIPIVGPILERLFFPLTYYTVDTALMFQETVKNTVNEVIDGITKSRGIRALSELEKKPIMREFFLK